MVQSQKEPFVDFPSQSGGNTSPMAKTLTHQSWSWPRAALASARAIGV